METPGPSNFAAHCLLLFLSSVFCESLFYVNFVNHSESEQIREKMGLFCRLTAACTGVVTLLNCAPPCLFSFVL